MRTNNKGNKLMSYTHTIVADFPSHAEAERVVLDLQKEGFDAGKFMILVTGSDEDVRQAKQRLDRISHEISMSIAV